MKRNHHTVHKGDNLRLMRVMSAPLVLEQHIVTRVLHFVCFGVVTLAYHRSAF